jgi:micrococcal nuclease
MAKKLISLVVIGVAGYIAAAGAPFPVADASTAAPAWFNVQGKVTRVVDGDTIHVRVNQKTERVRFIGIDSPEAGGCYSGEAKTALRRLVLGKRVKIVGDRTQARRDIYKRLLAYVALPTGVDVGRLMLQRGLAEVFETRPAFARRTSYLAASSAARGSSAGMWSACSGAVPTPPVTTPTMTTPTPVAPTVPTTTTPAPPRGNCHASYPDVCIAPAPPDLDCGQVAFKRFRVIYTVPDPDPHRFDGDRDGIGCES